MIKKTLGIAALSAALLGAPAIATTAQAGTVTGVATSTSTQAQAQTQAKDCWWSHGRWKCDWWRDYRPHHRNWDNWGHNNWNNNWGHRNHWNNNWGHNNWNNRY